MDDGKVPADNPFVKGDKGFASIWSYGHRNPQGLAMHPATGDLYDLEHGPRGGDEVNLVLPGRNYGWPVITWGMDYAGAPMAGSEGTSALVARADGKLYEAKQAGRKFEVWSCDPLHFAAYTTRPTHQLVQY